MSDAPLSLLAKLAVLSKIDGVLAQIGADKKRLETGLKDQTQKAQQKENEVVAKSNILNDRRTKQQREEKSLNDERHKLMDRRKALSSFSGAKIQEAAEREINATAEGLNNQEEALISGLNEIEGLEKEFSSANEALTLLKNALAISKEDYHKTVLNLEERQRVKEARRAEVAASIDRAALSTYGRVHERFPQNTVVAIKDKTCSGCFMSLVAQVVNLVTRGESLIKCPGCGRILCAESHLQESKEE